MRIPYATTPAVVPDDRYAQMAEAIRIGRERGYTWLTAQPIDERQTLSIACYGPSLADTWETLAADQQRGIKILSMSGATRFLADRGVMVDFHIDMDPRPYKANHLDPVVDGVHYLMATCCPSRTWELLKDQRVSLWHTQIGPRSDGMPVDTWVATYDMPGRLILHGGSTIGLTAVHLGGLLGYRHFEIHGMDGSFKDIDGVAARHSGIHFGKKYEPNYTWAAEGRTYRTTQIMSNAVAETINTISNFPVFTIFHGDGLTQALVREANVPNACTANQTEKAARIRQSCVRVPVMPPLANGAGSFWDALVDGVPPMMVSELLRNQRLAAGLRRYAKFNTGTIPLETALLLRAACVFYQPAVIAEVGTFIGTSTYALQARRALYTCDRSNDCLQADPTRHIITHPFQSATQMFERMIADGLHQQVDLFFIDGRLTREDLPLIEQLGHPKSVIILDDCTATAGGGKGLANVQLLQPLLPQHGIVPPPQMYGDGRVTLGAFVPLQAAGNV